MGLKKIFEKAVHAGALPEPSAAAVTAGGSSWRARRRAERPRISKTAVVVQGDGVGMTESFSGDVEQPGPTDTE